MMDLAGGGCGCGAAPHVPVPYFPVRHAAIRPHRAATAAASGPRPHLPGSTRRKAGSVGGGSGGGGSGSGSSGGSSSSSPSHSCGLPLGGGGGACELSATSLPTLVSSNLVAGERGEWSRVPWYRLLSPLFSHQLLFPHQPRSLRKERRKKCFLRGIR